MGRSRKLQPRPSRAGKHRKQRPHSSQALRPGSTQAKDAGTEEGRPGLISACQDHGHRPGTQKEDGQSGAENLCGTARTLKVSMEERAPQAHLHVSETTEKSRADSHVSDHHCPSVRTPTLHPDCAGAESLLRSDASLLLKQTPEAALRARAAGPHSASSSCRGHLRSRPTDKSVCFRSHSFSVSPINK